MSLLLSALVLAWGIVPAAVQHTHEGGHEPAHRHDDSHQAAHHGSHDHHSDDGHHEHAPVPNVSLLADNVLHLHWQFLGMEFSMPAPEEPADNGGDERTAPQAIVRTMNEEGLTTQAGPSIGRVRLAVAFMRNADVVRNPEPVPRPPNLITSIPLCDSARLERSGVLLA